jgi:hypothetical protein
MTDQGFQRVEEGAQLELSGGRLPTARTIRAELRTQLNSAVLAERDRRGEVLRPEDTWAMQRSLASVVEVCGEYSRAFADAVKEAKQIAEEELIEAVGEQDGAPNQGMTVPDAEGDVKISLDNRNDYEIDTEALASAIAFLIISDARGQISGWLGAMTSDNRDEAHEGYAATEDMIASFIIEAIREFTKLGTFKPGVMKARAFIKELGRVPDADGVASSVASSIRKTSQYKGVKVERVQEK